MRLAVRWFKRVIFGCCPAMCEYISAVTWYLAHCCCRVLKHLVHVTVWRVSAGEVVGAAVGICFLHPLEQSALCSEVQRFSNWNFASWDGFADRVGLVVQQLWAWLLHVQFCGLWYWVVVDRSGMAAARLLWLACCSGSARNMLSLEYVVRLAGLCSWWPWSRAACVAGIMFSEMRWLSPVSFVHSYVFILCMPSLMPFHHVPPRRITLCQSSWSWRHEIDFSWHRTFFAIVASLLWNFRPASRGWYWQRAREREREREIFGLRETTYKLVERDLAEEWSWHRWEDKKK